MPNFNQAIPTNNAMKLITNILAGKTKIEFTRTVASDKDYSNLTEEQIANLSTIENIKQDVSIKEVNVLNSDTVTIPLRFDNTDVLEDYQIFTIGVYARELDGSEILYSVLTAKTPQLQPAYDGVSPTTFKINAETIVGKAANVEVIVNPMDNVTIDQLNSQLTEYVKIVDLDKLIAEKIPDTLTDSTKNEHITGTWNFDHANIGGYGIASTSYVDSKVSNIKIPDTLADTTQNEQISATWNFLTKGTLKIGGVNVATLDDIGQQIDGTTLLHRDPDTGTVVESSNYNAGDLTVDNKNVATEDYVNGKVSSISVPDTLTDRTKNENITGAWDFTAITISSKHVATEPYVDSKVSGLASQEYVNTKVNGLASESYVNDKVTGLATEDFVNGKVSDATATQNFNGDWNTLKSNGTYYSTSGTNLPPVSAYWLLRVTANKDGSRVEQIAFQDNGDAVWIRHLNSSWSSWTQLVDKKYVDDKVQGVLDQLTTKLTKLNFSYGNLTVDNDPVVPIVMVADEDTAKSQDASKPHTQHEWSDE